MLLLGRSQASAAAHTVMNLLARMDADGDGSITYPEVTTALSSPILRAPHHPHSHLFRCNQPIITV